jgi:hypothetical protein
MSSNNCNETNTTETSNIGEQWFFEPSSYSQDNSGNIEKSYISMAFDAATTTTTIATDESEFPPLPPSHDYYPLPPPLHTWETLHEGAIVNPDFNIMEMPLIISTSSNSHPPQLPPTPFVVEPTHYHINKSTQVSTVISTIVNALVKYKVGLISFSSYKLKCYYEYTNPKLKTFLPEDISDQATTRCSFMIKIFSLPKDSDSGNYNMVEFQRRSGDGSTFCRLYDKISTELDLAGLIDHSVPRSSQSFHQFKLRQRQRLTL